MFVTPCRLPLALTHPGFASQVLIEPAESSKDESDPDLDLLTNSFRKIMTVLRQMDGFVTHGKGDAQTAADGLVSHLNASKKVEYHDSEMQRIVYSDEPLDHFAMRAFNILLAPPNMDNIQVEDSLAEIDTPADGLVDNSARTLEEIQDEIRSLLPALCAEDIIGQAKLQRERSAGTPVPDIPAPTPPTPSAVSFDSPASVLVPDAREAPVVASLGANASTPSGSLGALLDASTPSGSLGASLDASTPSGSQGKRPTEWDTYLANAKAGRHVADTQIVEPIEKHDLQMQIVKSGSNADVDDDPITIMVRNRMAEKRAEIESQIIKENNAEAALTGTPAGTGLIDMGDFLMKLDENKRSELWRAANKGQAGKVALYLRAEQVNVNQVDKHGRTALWISCNLGRDEVVNLLLADKRVEINIADNDSHTPLYTACNLQRDSIVKMLLAKERINVNRPDREGVCALWLAANQGGVDRLKMLLAMPDIDVNNTDNNGVSPLWAAVNQNKIEVATELLANPQVNANLTHKDGRSPLFVAAGLGHTKCTEMLLAWKGMDANYVDKDGVSALWAAANQGHGSCVKLLLATTGIEANRPTKDGVTPLYTAVNRGHVDCTKMLLDFPDIDVNFKDGNSVTALYAAANLGHDECVRLLLTHPDIDVNCTNYSLRTPLFTAAEKSKVRCLKMLLEAPGIKINHQDTEGCSALCIAGNQGSDVCMQMLLNMPGVAVDQYTVDMTPLASRMLNVAHPRLNCFGRLLASGLLSAKIVTKNQKWLQRKKKTTQDPASFLVINNALHAIEDFKKGKKPWCATCFEVRPSLLNCGRCKQVWYCSAAHQKSHWKMTHKKECSK